MENRPEDPLTEMADDRFGIKYLFPYQRLVISNILEAAENAETESAGSRQIVILPTGAGKSLCFMLPALLLPGPTLIIFPLLSLMADQKRRCDDAGISSVLLKGGQNEAERTGLAGARIILTNPETALSPKVLPLLKKAGISHLVFDEVHTVSEWGDSFRPACLEAGRLRLELSPPVTTAFTATASDSVLNRVNSVLFPEGCSNIIRANPDRPNISYSVIPCLCKMRRLEEMLRLPPDAAGSITRPALVFCSSRKTAERTALEIKLRLGISESAFYHAGLSPAEKKKVEDWFFSSRSGILAATTAYGMGIDKPDIRTVIHMDLSPSVEAYLQESGRAGRDRQAAEAFLLLTPSDLSPERFNKSSGPERKKAVARYGALLSFALDSNRCRRESLLALLGAEPEACFGCDVCSKTARRLAPEKSSAALFIKRNRRRFTRTELVTAICRFADSGRRGEFSGWKKADISEAVDQLILSGAVRIIKKGPWKNLLTAGRNNSYYQKD